MSRWSREVTLAHDSNTDTVAKSNSANRKASAMSAAESPQSPCGA